MTVLVFDNTPLSHSLAPGALSVLESLTSVKRCVAPAEVIKELLLGSANTRLSRRRSTCLDVERHGR